jgi:hypothetical protein
MIKIKKYSQVDLNRHIRKIKAYLQEHEKYWK